jgi:hypothetical protein
VGDYCDSGEFIFILLDVIVNNGSILVFANVCSAVLCCVMLCIVSSTIKSISRHKHFMCCVLW